MLRIRPRGSLRVFRKGNLPASAGGCCALLACVSLGYGQGTVTVSPPEVADTDPSGAGQQPAAARSLSIITGTVQDAQGALIVGAHLELRCAMDTTPRETTSGTGGQFVFPNVAPGAFTLSVTLTGFSTVVTKGILPTGQNLVLKPITLPIAPVNITVNAVVSQEELGVEEVHAEEQQRLAGVLPNFFVSYNWTAPPLTTKQKFTLAWKNASDPGNLLLVGTVAGVQQADNAFPGYHQGAQGYGKRYGADLANLWVGTFMGGAVLPTLFRQDPRYFYKGSGSIRSRFLYAVSTAVICRGDNGHRQPAFASVLGDLSAGAISNIYYPASDRQGATLTLENGLLGIAGDAMNNVFQEFFLKKLTPKAHHSNAGSDR